MDQEENEETDAQNITVIRRMTICNIHNETNCEICYYSNSQIENMVVTQSTPKNFISNESEIDELL